MFSKDFKLGVHLDNNPLTHNLYYEEEEEGIVAPGNAKIIGKEDLTMISKENGTLITTEGT